ncbi:MAG TPA: hypothetical protein DD725_12830 [Deltaproteobacteria bacterium]|nr:hypothetical protein [Deltaproteobacteria bacterium]
MGTPEKLQGVAYPANPFFYFIGESPHCTFKKPYPSLSFDCTLLSIMLYFLGNLKSKGALVE